MRLAISGVSITGRNGYICKGHLCATCRLQLLPAGLSMARWTRPVHHQDANDMSTGPILQPELSAHPDEPQRQDQWKAHSSGVQLAFVWAVTGVAGAVAISISPATTIARLLTPVLCMAAYTWATYPRMLPPGLRAARIAHLADSAYFLGFLSTLWALIDSFVLRRTDPNAAAFRAFGYALFTTAAGMAIRLYLLNFKCGAEEQAGEAEVLIEARLQALVNAMSTAQAAVADFSRRTEVLNGKVASLSQT